MVSQSWFTPSSSNSIPQPDTTGAADSRYATMPTTMPNPHIHRQPEKNPTDPDKVSRVARKSPVDGLDMQRFFGTYWRPKPTIDLPQRSLKEGPAVKPRSTVASHDLGLPHELVETILSHLSIFDLIVATGINTTFRTIIQNSPMLQQKLFLRPMQGSPRYVQVEHPDYGYRTLVAGKSGADEHKNDKESRNEHNGLPLSLTIRASADPRPKSEWQWTRKLAVATLCPFLLHDHYGGGNRSVRYRVLYDGGEKVQFNELTAFAESWANMYLTNPPCTEVIAHMSYHDGILGEVCINADRTVSCESGVTIASLLEVLHMGGDVKITTGPWGGG